MNIVGNAYSNNQEMTISTNRPVDSRLEEKNSELLLLLKEKEQKIVELERLLNLKSQELLSFKLLHQIMQNPNAKVKHQDLPLNQPNQWINEQNKTFDNSKNLLWATQRFMYSLKQRFPALTSNDLRICSLLRQNLSTKEVALYLGIGSDSANKARYRIRKKCKLRRGDDLIQFLLEF